MWLNTMESRVLNILIVNPESRDNDRLLFVEYLKRYNPELVQRGYADVMLSGDLPSYEGITRARRKLQEKNPELRGILYEQRNHKQNDYVQYASET